jgi:hypothetical protein
MKDIIRFSLDDFVCRQCGKTFSKGSLVNEFEVLGCMDRYCMGCLEKMDISDHAHWESKYTFDRSKAEIVAEVVG